METGYDCISEHSSSEEHDGYYCMIFWHACKMDDADSIQEMIDNEEIRKTIDFNHTRGRDGETPLGIAAEYNCPNAIELLVRYEVGLDLDVNKPNRHNETPLIVACRMGYKTCATLILRSPHIYVNHVPRTLNQKYTHATALWFATYQNMNGVVKILLERPEIDLNFRETVGFSAFDVASFHQNENIVKMILASKAHTKLDISQVCVFDSFSHLYSEYKKDREGVSQRLRIELQATPC